ncbi:DnaD domain protein [Alicyclobacillus sp. SO9]|uniref:DnaD domain protein n=1 Tax=Alicyclobacillus sp. SO9 TaxID=2665646 RepID=UPI0018E6FBEA|nr:DnaD domain protein [Alicyclobacillus sp. SO9]QQE79515.1 DnaD domain protein [Alicyclobacillus sp. SO9]
MNYIEEVNAFYNRLEVTPLSSSAIALWFALLHICNKTGWTKEFSAAVGMLSLKSGLGARTIVNARNELKTKGYIDWKSRGGRKAAVYHVELLCANTAHNASDNTSDNVSYNPSHNVSDNSSKDDLYANIAHNVSGNASTLKDLKDLSSSSDSSTTPTSTTAHEPIVEIWKIYEEEDFGKLTPMIRDKLQSLVEEYSVEWVREALVEAVMYNARSFVYVDSMLKSWLKEGGPEAARAKREAAAAAPQKPAAVVQGQRRSRQSDTKAPEPDGRYSNFYKLFPDS